MQSPNIKDLSIYHDREDYIRATADQIVKDFAFYSIDLEFGPLGDHPYDTLYTYVHPVIEELVDYNYPKLLPILYRIDITHQQIEQTHDMNPDQRVSESITHLILARELQKVVLRKHFSSGESSEPSLLDG